MTDDASFPKLVSGPMVEFGGCWDSSTKDNVHCQMDKSGCDGNDKNGNKKPPFRSALQLRENGYPSGNLHCHARNVDATHGVPVKRCDLLDMCQVGECHGDGKESGSSVEDCNLVEHATENTATLFGACRVESSNTFTGCFFSETDCQTGEEFVSPDQLFRHYFDAMPLCDCTEVRVGLCTDDDFSACAVSEAQCAPDERFVSARELMANPTKYDNIDCRLCREGALSEKEKARTMQTVQKRRDDLARSSGRGGAVVLAVLLSLAAAGVVLYAIYWYQRRKAASQEAISNDADIMGKPYRDTMDEDEDADGADFANAHAAHMEGGMADIDLNGGDAAAPRQID